MKKVLIPIILSILVLVFIFSYQSGELSGKVLKLVFCDVGQGDAIYIRTPGGADILVDGGPNNKVLKCLSDNMPIWDRELELVFASHPDSDHIVGLISVLESYSVKSFNTVSVGAKTKNYKVLKKTILEKKIPYREISAGDNFSISDGIRIETKWPARKASASVAGGSTFAKASAGKPVQDTNESSLVQLLKYRDFDLLLTGDITYQILDTLDFGSNPIEVLKLPHHGSKTGVDSLTFERIHASLAIVSAGKNNSYHHPHPSVINLLNKFGIKYKRTDESGSIQIITDGKTTRLIN